MEIKTIEDLRACSKYEVHHIATRRGYESRKREGHVEPYKGKFGEGYIAVKPRWDTTQYVTIIYYILRN